MCDSYAERIVLLQQVPRITASEFSRLTHILQSLCEADAPVPPLECAVSQPDPPQNRRGRKPGGSSSSSKRADQSVDARAEEHQVIAPGRTLDSLPPNLIQSRGDWSDEVLTSKYFSMLGLRFVKMLPRGVMASGIVCSLYRKSGVWTVSTKFDNGGTDETLALGMVRQLLCTIESARIDKYVFDSLVFVFCVRRMCLICDLLLVLMAGMLSISRCSVQS